MADYLLALSITLLIILGLIVVHELGHYAAARLVGVRVRRLSLGVGKRLVGVTSTRSGIDYCLSAIPVGGYVRLARQSDEQGRGQPGARPFDTAHPWRQLIVLAAGPLASIALGLLLWWLALALGTYGLRPVVGELSAPSAAAQAGIERMDVITGVNSHSISTWQQLQRRFLAGVINGQQITLTIERSAQPAFTTTLPAAPGAHQADDPAQALGLILYDAPDDAGQLLAIHQPHTLTAALAMAVEKFYRAIRFHARFIPAWIDGRVAAGAYSFKTIIAPVAGVLSEHKFQTLLLLVGLISLNIGVLNLLPLPFLDGSGMLIVAVQWLLGGPLTPAQRRRCARILLICTGLLTGLVLLQSAT